MGTKELAELNAKRTLEYNNMTPDQRRAYHKEKFSAALRRGRPKLPPEEKKRRQREVAKAHYDKTKGTPEYRERQKQNWERRKAKRAAARQAAGNLSPIASG